MNIINFISIACFALCIVIFLYLRWYIKKRTTFTGLDNQKAELAQLKNDIDWITDRDAQLIEDRINQLKTLLHDVDKRIAIYEREVENFSVLENKRQSDSKKETLYSSLGRGIREALTQPHLVSAPEQDEQFTSVSDVLSPVNSHSILPVSRLSGENNTPSDNIMPKEDNKPPSMMQIRSSIDSLVNEGLSSEEIANRLNISAAEVNLAMKLSGKNRKN